MFTPKSNYLGCDKFTSEDFDADFYSEDSTDMKPIVLLERGNCSFVTKVRNAEKLGVKLVIIGDNRKEDAEHLIMDDDGSGHSISIPSMIINKKDADIIREAIKKTP